MNQTIDLPPFKVLLIDDHKIFLQGLDALIKSMAPQADVYHVTSVDKAKAALLNEAFQFVLSDLAIPGDNVIEFLMYCKKKYPAIIIMVISSNLDISIVKQCFGIGVSSYLSKATNTYELKIAFEKTYIGDTYVSSDLSGKLATSLFISEKTGLTKKEIEILRLVAAGDTVDKMASKLLISPYTVMSHRRNIMSKLNLHSASELVKYAFENNLQ
jgi:DNA-binding NarL/FixJ family response regulator